MLRRFPFRRLGVHLLSMPECLTPDLDRWLRLEQSNPVQPLSLRLGYRPEPATKIRRSRYRSRTRGTANTRPHQRPVEQSTTTITAIKTASSDRITSDDFRCCRSQSTILPRYNEVASGIPTSRRIPCSASNGDSPSNRAKGRSNAAITQQLVISEQCLQVSTLPWIDPILALTGSRRYGLRQWDSTRFSSARSS